MNVLLIFLSFFIFQSTFANELTRSPKKIQVTWQSGGRSNITFNGKIQLSRYENPRQLCLDGEANNPTILYNYSYPNFGDPAVRLFKGIKRFRFSEDREWTNQFGQSYYFQEIEFKDVDSCLSGALSENTISSIKITADRDKPSGLYPPLRNHGFVLKWHLGDTVEVYEINSNNNMGYDLVLKGAGKIKTWFY